jgi:general secretion pathway protein K
MQWRTLKNDRGIALFMVLWVLILLSVIVGEFCHAMRTEMNVTRNYKEQSQAYYIALAGFNRAVVELVKQDGAAGKTVVRDDGIASVFQSVLKKTVLREEPSGEEADIETSQWRINVDIPPEKFGAGDFQVRIGNESGKIDINQASEPMLKMLLDVFDLDEKEKSIIADSILDWRDENDLHRLNGAEDDYYRSLKRPYECKDADFDTVEELLLVRGVTEDLFHGGLKEMVTVMGDGRSASRQGRKTVQFAKVSREQKINLNAASSKMLRSLPGMTDESVEAIVAYRKESDFIALNDLISAIGAETVGMIQPFITFQPSPHYTVEVVGSVAGTPVRRGIEALVQVDKGQKTGYRILRWRDRLRQDSSPRM